MKPLQSLQLQQLEHNGCRHWKAAVSAVGKDPRAAESSLPPGHFQPVCPHLTLEDISENKELGGKPEGQSNVSATGLPEGGTKKTQRRTERRAGDDRHK